MTEFLDAELIRHWAQAGTQVLRDHRAELNALNVFPVPDGDTGTNLYLTFKAAAEAEAQRIGELDDAKDALAAMARGALLGARGNSGVILAQVLGAFAITAESGQPLSLAKLLVAGAQAARSAVAEPVEGTALTVLDAAAGAFAANPEVAAVAAREALAKTPEMLESLKQAGVVDAGGRGVVLLMDALKSVWYGVDFQSPPVGRVPQEMPLGDCTADAEYEVMFLIDGAVSHELRAALGEVGVSLTISSDGVESQIHIHSDQPEQVLRLIDRPRNLRIERLSREEPVRLIAQASGNPLVQLLASAGVLVVPGEAGARAAVSDFVAAGVKSGAQALFILPGDEDSFSVAEIAAKELAADIDFVSLIPTRSIAETLAAVSVFNADLTPKQLVNTLTQAASQVRTLRFVQAGRAAHTDLGMVEPGQILVFLDGELVGVSVDLVDALCAVLVPLADIALVTLIPGFALTQDDLSDCLDSLTSLLPEVELQTVGGGQNSSLLTVGLE